MGLFSVKRVKPIEKQESFAVQQPEQKPAEQKDTMEIENEKIDEKLSKIGDGEYGV
jgi:hypothetical protein